MKKSMFLCLIIAGVLSGCVQQKDVTSRIEGVWQVVSWQRIADDTLMWELGEDYAGSEMAIWSGDYFSFVGSYTRHRDSVIIENYGGGTYKLDSTHYEESYLYFGDKSMVGTSQKLLLEIKDDTLIQTWPCDDTWLIDTSNYSIQKLVRKN